MCLKRMLLIFFLSGILLSLNVAAAAKSIETDCQKPCKEGFVPEEIIIKLKSDYSENELSTMEDTRNDEMTNINTVNSKFKARSMIQIYPHNSKQRSEFSNVYKIEFDESLDIESALHEYQKLDEVEYAEPNYLYHIESTMPNDPRFDDQWGLHQINDCDIDAPEAWDIEKGSDEIVIAIHDTGIDYTHPDLKNRIWVNTNEISGNGIDDDGNGFIDDVNGWDFVSVNSSNVYPGEDAGPQDNDPMDVQGHGTHCAGISCAMTDNSLGVAGVCWNCKIMPVRAGYKNIYGGGTLENEDCAAGIIYAADNGAHIISMSWGGTESSQLIQDALDYAYEKGVVLIAAAGNDDTDVIKYPSGYPNVISVAATDTNDQKASFSNYGDWVDISAPGDDILSTVPVGIGLESSFTIEDVEYETNVMFYSGIGSVTGELYDVGFGRAEDVSGLNLTGKIALIERGEISFMEKVSNVYDKGAVGAVVFNNIPGNFNGDLQVQHYIPAVSINQSDGQTVRTLISSGTTVGHLEVFISDYESKSGTSMACPMVAGVAGLILSKDPTLGNSEVKYILCSTADPLYSEFDLGAGRVNAYQALQSMELTSVQAPLLSPVSLLVFMALISSVGLIELKRKK